jgi:hypothetical protein
MTVDTHASAAFEDAELERLISSEMKRGDLESAAEHATIYAARRGGMLNKPVTITIPKLEHDVAQMLLLRERGVLGDEIAPMISEYRKAIAAMMPHGKDARLPIASAEFDRIRDGYNCLLYVRPTPRVSRALSDTWNPNWVEGQYLEAARGLVVVDDFLSGEALHDLVLFCLESTIWFENRYAYGRLGAFFEAGFNCPLLIQIAEELRRVLPRVIGERYPLRQMWAFKYPATLEADRSTHADFAAVTVNFWITTDEANLDPECGGLVIYDMCAPSDWGFERYQNTDWEKLGTFLRERASRATKIPYRQNRAIVFDSDLFHGTDKLRFRPEYEHRRINVTMLFGEREDDIHYPMRPDTHAAEPAQRNGWRSAAFARVRGRR